LNVSSLCSLSPLFFVLHVVLPSLFALYLRRRLSSLSHPVPNKSTATSASCMRERHLVHNRTRCRCQLPRPSPTLTLPPRASSPLSLPVRPRRWRRDELARRLHFKCSSPPGCRESLMEFTSLCVSVRIGHSHPLLLPHDSFVAKKVVPLYCRSPLLGIILRVFCICALSRPGPGSSESLGSSARHVREVAGRSSPPRSLSTVPRTRARGSHTAPNTSRLVSLTS
jgi:hypothetical protein